MSPMLTRWPSRDAARFLSLMAMALSLALSACAPVQTVPQAAPPAAPRLADPNATAETRALFINLQRLSQDRILFGHHDTLAYGVQWTDVPGRSDVRDVVGDYPAVYGWDVARLFKRGKPDEFDAQRADQLRSWIREGYARGGVITLAWHMPNPVTDTDSWDTTRAVDAILPNGRLHDDFKSKLDVVADFLHSLKSADGKSIPVMFRPYHEHTGSWFWWGREHSSIAEFKALWQFTVQHLRDTRDVRNVLYAYSTDVFDSEAEFLERYPGDAYIDLLGFDDYHSVKTVETRATFINRLRILASLARQRGKLAALTETGVEAVPDPNWWTNVLLPALKSPAASGISYVLVWRNANHATDRKSHFYAPYRGHASAVDLVRFEQDPFTVFESDLPDLYKLPNE